MGVCAFSDDYLMLDVTAVDNLFIEEYMLRAPGDYVKVYLYGLRLCYGKKTDATMERMAWVLGLEEDMVADAFSYWEAQGLVRRLSDNPPAYEYVSLRKAVLMGEMRPADRGAYADGDFNAAVRALMAGRVLHAADYAKLYDWMDGYGFSPEAMLKIIGFYVEDTRKKGKKQPPTIAFLEKRVLELAKKNAVTDDAVRDELYAQDDDVKAARQLLRHMGIIKPAPSADEMALYRKWRGWGFDLDLLRLLCRDMTKIQTPNMAYLDKIVENYHDMGATTAKDIEKYDAQAIAPLRRLLGELGSSAKLNRPLADRYLGWLAQGFEPEALMIIAADLKRGGRSTLDHFEQRLETMRQRGAFTAASLNELTQRRKRVADLARQVLAVAGEPREPSASERAQVDGWLLAGTQEGLLPVAAAMAKGADRKMAYIASVLASWRAQGINTAEDAAKAGHQPGQNGRQAPGRASKEVAEHRYEQRKYDEKDLETLLYDLDGQEGEA